MTFPECHFLINLSLTFDTPPFVLSGFIITFSNKSKAGEENLLGNYFSNRLIRIYTPYLPLGILMYLAYLFFPSLSANETSRDVSLITSLFLLPHGNPALSVAWTLTFEMLFYTFFCLWFVSKKLTHLMFNVWLLIALSHLSIFDEKVYSISLFNLLTSHYIIEFLVGYWGAIYFINRNKEIKNRLNYLLLLMIYFFSSAFFISCPHDIKGIIFSFGFISLIILSINSFLDNFSLKSIWMKIGNASYSIYLVHNVAISIFLKAAIYFSLTSWKPILMIAIYSVCIFVGIVYSWIFEEKAMKHIKQNIIRR